MNIITVYEPLCSSHRHFSHLNYIFLGFPGGAVVENPPANAGDTGSSPGPGRSHMHGATKPVCHNY